MIGYVARRIGYDAEECIQKAPDDDEIETHRPSPDGDRGYDVYRLRARGRRASGKHLREGFMEPSEASRREHGERMRNRTVLGFRRKADTDRDGAKRTERDDAG